LETTSKARHGGILSGKNQWVEVTKQIYRVKPFLFNLRKSGPQDQVRDDRLCHRSNLVMVSGVRFQVSENTESWTLIWLQLKTNTAESKCISWATPTRRVEAGC